MKIKITFKCGSCSHHGYCKYEEKCKPYSEKELNAVNKDKKNEYPENLVATIDCEGFKDITKPQIKGDVLHG